MRRAGRQMVPLLVVCAAAGAVVGELERVTVGALDLAGLLPDGRADDVTAACRNVLGHAGLSVAVVLESAEQEPPPQEEHTRRRRGKPEPAPPPPPERPAAQRWLEAWLAQPPPETEQAAAEGGNAEEAAEPVPTEHRVVLHLALSGPTLDVAVTTPLDLLLPRARAQQIVWEHLDPALGSRDVDRIAAALVATVEALGRTVTRSSATSEAEDEPMATASFQPPPTPWWSNAWWVVALPALLFTLAACRREGLGRGLVWLPLLALLYGGLYFWILFRPGWLWLFGGAAVAPVVMLASAPRAGPRATPPRVRVASGGFGTSGFGALGLGRGTS